MEQDIRLVTVVNGIGEKVDIPSNRLEEYKKIQAELYELAKAKGSSPQTLKVFEIKEIIED